MCSGGGGGGGNTTAQTQAQLTEQAQVSAAQLAEQQREFAITTAQTNQATANQAALQAANQAAVDQQAALTNEWQTGQAAEEATATKTVNDAFAQFTPAYYAQYTKDYIDNYTPQLQQQSDAASNATTFGLARSGNLDSQTAANQIAQNAQTDATAQEDINNQAIAATTAEQNSVLAAKQNLMSQATSAATLGSPITPGSADAITANFNNTSNALTQLTNQAGDTTTTLAATPQYASLGTVFGNAASGANAIATGQNNLAYGQAFNTGISAASPTASAGRVGS